MRLNGKETIQVETLHGSFAFREQRLVLADGSDSRYLAYTAQEAVSIGLQELCVYFCNRLSYQEVGRLVERVTGQPLLCQQTLWNWVQRKAAEIDAALAAQVSAAQPLPFPPVAESVDIYDPQAEEVLVLTDGICVKAQKPTRQKADAPRPEKTDKRHDTDVMLVEGQDGAFEYLSGSTDARVSLVEVAGAYLRREWGQRQTPLPVVALTDGARKIRNDLERLFGSDVRVILDWYHLSKRVYQHLSMSAHSRAEREVWEKQVLASLWKGQTEEAVFFLSSVSARNVQALAELVGYLQKHACEIIDYARRQAIGKPIGSGRMEKAVDQVIGMRQKKKGMSWTARGSRALALLKIAELNGQWQQLWAAKPILN